MSILSAGEPGRAALWGVESWGGGKASLLTFPSPPSVLQPREPRSGFTALELLLEKGFQRISEAPAQLRAGERRNPGGMAVSSPGQGRGECCPSHPLCLSLPFPLGKNQPCNTPRITFLCSPALSALAAPAQSLQRDDPDGICNSQGLRNAGEAELPLPELTGGTWGTLLLPPATSKTSSTEEIPKPLEAPAVQNSVIFGRFPYSRGDHDLLYKSPPLLS